VRSASRTPDSAGTGVSGSGVPDYVLVVALEVEELERCRHTFLAVALALGRHGVGVKG
jgi:hypothetical protein